MYYLWVKVIHILAVISWMAGILYLYRLLVNMRDNINNTAALSVLKRMAHRLYHYITLPAMIVSLSAGTALVVEAPWLFREGVFLHVKIVLVLALLIATAHAGSLTKSAQHNPESLPSSRHLRMLNEVPTILMILIVILIVVRPF